MAMTVEDAERANVLRSTILAGRSAKTSRSQKKEGDLERSVSSLRVQSGSDLIMKAFANVDTEEVAGLVESGPWVSSLLAAVEVLTI